MVETTLLRVPRTSEAKSSLWPLTSEPVSVRLLLLMYFYCCYIIIILIIMILIIIIIY